MPATLGTHYSQHAYESNGEAGDFSPETLRRQCIGMARRRAALAALTSLIPIPGIDLVSDIALLLSVIEETNRRYGLTRRQIEQLSPARKAIAYRLASSAGGFLAARISASQTIGVVLRKAGLRLGFMEAARFAPVVGQIIAAFIAYFTLTYLARRHIDQCAGIVEAIRGVPGGA